MLLVNSIKVVFCLRRYHSSANQQVVVVRRKDCRGLASSTPVGVRSSQVPATFWLFGCPISVARVGAATYRASHWPRIWTLGGQRRIARRQRYDASDYRKDTRIDGGFSGGKVLEGDACTIDRPAASRHRHRYLKLRPIVQCRR